MGFGLDQGPKHIGPTLAYRADLQVLFRVYLDLDLKMINMEIFYLRIRKKGELFVRVEVVPKI